MSSKKKPVTVASLAKSASKRKPAGKSTKARRTSTTVERRPPPSARTAYDFVSEKKPRAKQAEPPPQAETQTFREESDLPKQEGLCRIPLVRRAKEAMVVAKGAVDTAKQMGEVLRDRLLSALAKQR